MEEKKKCQKVEPWSYPHKKRNKTWYYLYHTFLFIFGHKCIEISNCSFSQILNKATIKPYHIDTHKNVYKYLRNTHLYILASKDIYCN